MLTNDELPPAPKFSVTKWMFSGLMAWSLFFGAIGGLGVLLLADYGPEKISPNRELRQDVATVDSRVDALEYRTQKLHEQQKNVAQQAATAQDSSLTKVLIGLTQLKTAYDNDTSMDVGIATLKSVIKDSGILQSLNDLETLTMNNFPSKEKILADLDALQTPVNQNLKNEKGEQPLDWKSRAKLAFSQLVRVTPTNTIAKDKEVSRVEQAVAAGDFTLAKKFTTTLPANPATQMITAEISARSQAEYLVQKIVNQVSAAIGTAAQGSLY